MAYTEIPNPTDDPTIAELNRVNEEIARPLKSTKEAKQAALNAEPAPVHYRVDGQILILEQQRGEDALVDQFRDQIEAAQKITTDVAEAVAKVNADTDLSAEGKQKRIAEINRAAMKKLATTAETLDRHDELVREQMLEPLPFVQEYQTGDFASPVIDIALIQAFKGLDTSAKMQAIAAMQSGGEQRMCDAILRMPAVLTGLSTTALQNIREAATNRAHPEEVKRRRSLEKAASAARAMVAATVGKVGRDGRLSRQEQRELLGDAARHFPGLF